MRIALVRHSLRNDPEERTSHVLRGGSQKSRKGKDVSALQRRSLLKPSIKLRNYNFRKILLLGL